MMDVLYYNYSNLIFFDVINVLIEFFETNFYYKYIFFHINNNVFINYKLIILLLK